MALEPYVLDFSGIGLISLLGSALGGDGAVAGVIGAALVLASAAFLPYAMAAAAGAMHYVVVEELMPETVRSGTTDVATLGFIAGFAVVMFLDNALG